MTPQEVRAMVAKRFIAGSGIEIGALHNPMVVENNTTVRYIDHLTHNQLRVHYPELAHATFVDAQIDDGEKLTTIPDNTQDFVIASHVFEHFQDPIGSLKNFVRVLRPGGYIFIAIPNRREIFDRDRPATTIDHLILDHTEGPQRSYELHLREYATLHQGLTAEADIAALIERYKRSGFSIHYHCWDKMEFFKFLVYQLSEQPLDMEYFDGMNAEIYAVLRKRRR